MLTNDAAGTLAIKLLTASPERGSGVVVANNGGKDFFADNVIATGQTIAVTGTGTKLGFLGFSTTHGVTESGTLHFTDGTSQPFTLTLSDWTDITPATGDTAVAKATYANQHTSAYNGSTTTATGSFTVWAYALALPSGKTLASVTLPNLAASGATSQHLFAIAVG